MKLLEGIQLHELILIILGFILGLALIFIFLYTALRSKPNLKLLYGFIAPLVMIGYPSIQSVQFSKDVIKIDKLVEKVNQNPTDTVAQNALRDNLAALPASRCKTSSDAMTVIANAQAALGAYESAKVTIEKAKVINPDNPKVTSSEIDIKDKWTTQKDFENRVTQLENYIKQLEAKPNNPKLIDTLSTHIQELILKSQKSPIHLENHQIVTVARATAIIGERERAVAINDEVLKVNPKDKEASKLKESIKNREIEEKFKAQRRINRVLKPKQRVETAKPTDKMSVPPAVSAPAPVYGADTTALRMRLIPRSVNALKIWNKDQ